MPKRTDTPDAAHAARNQRTPHSPAASPQEEELSAYELLERRSRELTEERAHGGFGTPQPPNAAVPLLYPKPRAERLPQKTGAERPAKRPRRSRPAKKR